MRTVVVLAASLLPLTLARPVAAQQTPATPARTAPDEPAPTPDQRVAAALEKKVTLFFEKTTIGELSEFLSDLLQVSVVVASGSADLPVSMHLRGVTAKAALTTAMGVTGLELSVGCGIVYLHPPGEGLGSIPALEPDLRARTVTFCLDDTPLADALVMVMGLTGVNFVTTPGAADGPKVTLRVRDLPVDLALAVFARQAGLECRVEHGVLILDRPR